MDCKKINIFLLVSFHVLCLASLEENIIENISNNILWNNETFSSTHSGPLNVKTFRLPLNDNDEKIILLKLIETLQEYGIALVDCTNKVNSWRNVKNIIAKMLTF